MSTFVASIVVPLPPVSPVSPVSPPVVGASLDVPSVGTSPPEPGDTVPTELGLAVASEPGTREVNGDRALEGAIRTGELQPGDPDLCPLPRFRGPLAPYPETEVHPGRQKRC